MTALPLASPRRAARTLAARLRHALTASCVLAAAVAFVPAAPAQTPLDLSRYDRLFDAEPTVEMDLRGALLGALRRSVRTDDPEMATVLAGVRGMQMRVYELDNAAGRRAMDGITALGRSLRADGWQSFLRVRDDGDYVDMLTRPETGAADGVLGGFVMLVVSPEDTETSVVMLNFIGRVDPEQAARVGRRLSDDRTGKKRR